MRIKVDISEEQHKALKLFAEQHNVSVSDILSNYIADLTCINSNGSDERDMASSYFQRTHLSWMYKDDEKWQAKMERKYGCW
jgi:hypothetical protein